MATNFKQFTKELKEMESLIKDEVADTIRDVGVEIISALLEPKGIGGTPKRTGWLRANYTITLNSPKKGTVGSQESVTTTQRDNLIAAFKNAKTDVILGADRVIINNSVPYGEAVNDGTDRQPPQNFIEKSTQRGLRRLNKTRIIGK